VTRGCPRAKGPFLRTGPSQRRSDQAAATISELSQTAALADWRHRIFEPLQAPGSACNVASMVRFERTDVREAPVAWADRSVTLVSRVWIASADTRWFALGGSYRRPVRVEVTGADVEDIPIRDHVMVTKLAAAAVLVATALIWRIRE